MKNPDGKFSYFYNRKQHFDKGIFALTIPDRRGSIKATDFYQKGEVDL